MSEKKPTPDSRARERKRCPVCGEISYSAAGVHPQCSVKKADAERALKLKEERASETQQQPESPRPTRWQKVCPSCQGFLHVRKTQCDCGHSFKKS